MLNNVYIICEWTIIIVRIYYYDIYIHVWYLYSIICMYVYTKDVYVHGYDGRIYAWYAWYIYHLIYMPIVMIHDHRMRMCMVMIYVGIMPVWLWYMYRRIYIWMIYDVSSYVYVYDTWCITAISSKIWRDTQKQYFQRKVFYFRHGISRNRVPSSQRTCCEFKIRLDARQTSRSIDPEREKEIRSLVWKL